MNGTRQRWTLKQWLFGLDKRRRTALWIAGMLLLMFTCAGLSAKIAAVWRKPAEPLLPAPDVEVQDVLGNPVHLSDLAGVPTVLCFWASWWEPCEEQLQVIQQVYEEYRDGRVRILLINLTDGRRETVRSATQFLQEIDCALPVLYDVNLEAFNAYGVKGIPATVFINQEGRMAGAVEDLLTEAALKKGISIIE